MRSKEYYKSLILSHAEELKESIYIIFFPIFFGLFIIFGASYKAFAPTGRLFKIRIKIWYKKWCYIGVFKLLIFNTLIYKIVL